MSEFTVLAGRFCIARIPSGAPLPPLDALNGFVSVSIDADETTIVIDESFTYPGAEIHRGWRALKLRGPLEFDLKGILASLLNPLSEAGVSVLAFSTYSTDYVLVLDHMLSHAVAALEGAGHKRIA